MSQDRPVLPAPHQVAVELWNTTVGQSITSRRSLIYHAWITLSATLLGFLMGTLLGMALAVLIVHNRATDRSLMPWIIASQTIPILAIAPMVVVVLASIGMTGLVPKALISTYLSFFPVVVGMVKGLRSPEILQLDLLRTYSASSWQAFWKLRFPSALPYLFTSMKVGVAASLVGAIVGELPTGAAGGPRRAAAGGILLRPDRADMVRAADGGRPVGHADHSCRPGPAHRDVPHGRAAMNTALIVGGDRLLAGGMGRQRVAGAREGDGAGRARHRPGDPDPVRRLAAGAVGRADARLQRAAGAAAAAQRDLGAHRGLDRDVVGRLPPDLHQVRHSRLCDGVHRGADGRDRHRPLALPEARPIADRQFRLALPLVGIAPIMVMWFGFDWQSKAAVVVVMTFFPMLVNAVAGLNASTRMEQDLMRTYAANYWQTLLKLRLPAAWPFIFNALKINSTLALIGAIVAEFFGTPVVGMGFRISSAIGRLNVDMVWASIAVAALAGSTFYGLIALTERAVTFWHPSIRGGKAR
jgi:ABC-type nitrate/sulfonate/bicarbonate transport system permease component